jgi:t-SNARE complex subunit (syntaxin)
MVLSDNHYTFTNHHVVNPDATPEEIDTIVEGGSQQVFAQAVSFGHLSLF